MAPPSRPPVLLHPPLPGVAEALAPLTRVRAESRLGDFLSQLGGRAWGAAVLGLGDGPLEPILLSRISGAVSSGVLVVTHAHPTVDRVLEAEAAGAAILLSEPPDPGRLAAFLEPYLVEAAHRPVPPRVIGEGQVVGTSPALTEAYRTVARVADSMASVLVSGASGTGKEQVARALHRRSPRGKGPFVAVNCAALPEGLLEAELFGYERGAFTGAVGRSEGRFGRAHGGTLFLDEVGEMGPVLQAKLLRALEGGEIERLGSGDTVRVDVRVVAATNRSLEGRVDEGRFRADLLYRLAVVQIHLPPLRDRTEDLLPLADHFAALFGERHGRPVRAFSRSAVDALGRRTWPGNVRELRNVLDRATLLARGGVIRSMDLGAAEGPAGLAPEGSRLDAGYPPHYSLREVEESHLRRVLVHTAGHLGEAAAILGIHRNTMTAKVREYGIDPRNPEARMKGPR